MYVRKLSNTLGRRSIREEMKHPLMNRRHATVEPEPLPIDPTPFNIMEHGGRYRRHSNCEYQHILFVLDTSGSIGAEEFKNVTNLLGQLTPLFCKPIKIAVMTFDHEYFVEFCFNEYDNSNIGRINAGAAISSIQYIRDGQGPGTRWTHTAGAVQCVCNYILSPLCHLEVAPNGCIDVDVVFITDGRANDPSRDVRTGH